MSWVDSFLSDITEKLTPPEFENFIGFLLSEMGFEDIDILGQSGDGGIDLKAIWKQSQVPGLEIDLDFIIQVKRNSPVSTINPRILRELRGAMLSGQLGLLITTGRVSRKTRVDGIRDRTRIISIIDGLQLARLCEKYEVGLIKEYRFDRDSITNSLHTQQQFFESEETIKDDFKILFPEDRKVSKSRTTQTREISDPASTLNKLFGEEFVKIGRKSIYHSGSNVFLVKRSKKYDRVDRDFWYGVTPSEMESVERYGITHFGFICADKGLVLIPSEKMSEYARSDILFRTPPEGQLKHYHMLFKEELGRMKMILKGGDRIDIHEYFLCAHGG